MHVIPAVLLSAVLCSGQDGRTEEILRKIDEAIRQQLERSRAELRTLIQEELRGAKPDPAPAGNPRALVTVDLLKKHAAYLASDELEGRCAGYPGNDKAADYIAEVMQKAGLKPAGDDGTYFQKFRLSGRETRNVIGLIEGTDPQVRDEIVVAGAHYDHVGTGEQQNYGRMGEKSEDQIWNGADDNGSGTATLLGIVRAFGEGRLAARRSILFILFSGEEAGLVGSRWYVNHPRVPISQHAFMLNLDMVGRNPQKPIEIHGVGSAEGGVIRKVVEGAVASSGLKAVLNDGVKLVGGDSDHSSFSDKGVPYAFFFSGFHADYHRSSDHPEKLAYDNMVKVAHASIDILFGMANLDERPKYAGKARPGVTLPDLEPSTPPRRMGVTVQELDDSECDDLRLAGDQGGLRVEGVHKGSVAEAAGVRIGDVVLSIAGSTLARGGTREELRKKIMEKVQPGREVEVVVLREGGRVTLKAKWSE